MYSTKQAGKQDKRANVLCVKKNSKYILLNFIFKQMKLKNERLSNNIF